MGVSKETISVRIKDTDDQIQQTLANLNQLLGYKKALLEIYPLEEDEEMKKLNEEYNNSSTD